ncbi:MAG TPA: hypothetical protein VM847_14185 [Tahibacter sp.]|nr:hypothetical protein [Tahibacter sp.]
MLSSFLSVAQAQGDRRDLADEGVHFAWADVVRVDPIYTYERVSRPERECYDAEVTHREDRRGNNTGATVLGAIIGGALGNQVGNRRRLAAVATTRPMSAASAAAAPSTAATKSAASTATTSNTATAAKPTCRG